MSLNCDEVKTIKDATDQIDYKDKKGGCKGDSKCVSYGQDGNYKELHIREGINDYIDYTDAPVVRALVQLVPYFGPLVDMYVANKAADIQYKRVVEFIEILNNKISNIEIQNTNEEENYDLFMKSLDGAMKTRSFQKKEYYAELLKKGLIYLNSNKDNKIEVFINLLDGFEDIHLNILKFAYEAPQSITEKGVVKEYPYKPFRVYDNGMDYPSLHKKISTSEEYTYNIICTNLLSNGFIVLGEASKDKQYNPHHTYTISPLGTEFVKWILE